MGKENLLGVVRAAKSELELAKEVESGRLNPKVRWAGEARASTAELAKEEEGLGDDLFDQLRTLLDEALNTGTLRSIARAVALSWDADFDSRVLRHVEAVMQRKSSEAILASELPAVKERRSLMVLKTWLDRATEMGLSEHDFAPMAEAVALNHELEEEARNLQDAELPVTSNRMEDVLREMGDRQAGKALAELLPKLEAEAEAAKVAMEGNQQKLNDSLKEFEVWKEKISSSEKLSKLQELHQAFAEVNPQNLEENVARLKQELENMRAEKVVLMMEASRKGGAAPAAGSEEREELLRRIAELEETEATLTARVDEAAKLGAKWMKGEKDKEFEAVLKEKEGEWEKVWKRKEAELQKKHRLALLQALNGLEASVKAEKDKECAQALDNLRVTYMEEIAALKERVAGLEEELVLLEQTKDREIHSLKKLLDRL